MQDWAIFKFPVHYIFYFAQLFLEYITGYIKIFSVIIFKYNIIFQNGVMIDTITHVWLNPCMHVLIFLRLPQPVH